MNWFMMLPIIAIVLGLIVVIGIGVSYSVYVIPELDKFCVEHGFDESNGLGKDSSCIKRYDDGTFTKQELLYEYDLAWGLNITGLIRK